MKTKIIYISGNEIFDMQDIRAAFDQVRTALALGPDTVLFGVPVDKADALSTDVIPDVSVATPAVAMPDIEIPTPVIEEKQIIETPTEKIPDIVDDDINPVTVEEAEEPAPVAVVTPQKKSRGRPKSVKKVEEVISEPVDDVVTDTPQDTGKVVSILSVLTSKPESAPEIEAPAPVDTDIIETPVSETLAETEIITDIVPSDDVVLDSDELPTDEDISEIATDNDIQEISIEDMITDDAPTVAVQSQEKTLEQLLESMTPLREDIEHEHHATASDSVSEIDLDTTTADVDISDDDDATLEQLATEFAENQDKIATAPKTENQGKIGKLKNILPFKKARRDDSGLMGDLFGWAGIAANDEDFAIPGFFTNAASKK